MINPTKAIMKSKKRLKKRLYNIFKMIHNDLI